MARCLATVPGCHPPDPHGRVGVAVSGGADSLALLLLAHARFPGRVAAATFDHGFRPESGAEARHVAAICAALGVPHATLRAPATPADAADADRGQPGGLQALARTWRYAALDRWCRRTGAPWLLTGHHADDQAETVLMRLARGSGVAGLSGIRPALDAALACRAGARAPDAGGGGTMVARPLLGFGRGELAAIVAAAGLEPVVDPSNASRRFDRTHARATLAGAAWIDPRRLAATAEIMRDTEAALRWATAAAWDGHVRAGAGNDWFIRPDGLPPAILRRLCDHAIRGIAGVAAPGRDARHRGDELTRFVERLRAGGAATLGIVMATPGPEWHLRAAPPRRPPAPGPGPSPAIRPAARPPRLAGRL